MRGKAYGSDEAENWPQRKAESEKEGKDKPHGKKGWDGGKKKEKEGSRTKEQKRPAIQESM